MRGHIMDVAVRRWVYGIGIALGAAAIVFGIATTEQVTAIVGVLAAVLGLVALPNVGEAGVQPKRARDTENL